MKWYSVDGVYWSIFFINITDDVIYKRVALSFWPGVRNDVREENGRVDYIKEFSRISIWVWIYKINVDNIINIITSLLLYLVSLSVRDFKEKSLSSFRCIHG